MLELGQVDRFYTVLHDAISLSTSAMVTGVQRSSIGVSL